MYSMYVFDRHNTTYIICMEGLNGAGKGPVFSYNVFSVYYTLYRVVIYINAHSNDTL
jgi:hypothetical protein